MMQVMFKLRGVLNRLDLFDFEDASNGGKTYWHHYCLTKSDNVEIANDG